MKKTRTLFQHYSALTLALALMMIQSACETQSSPNRGLVEITKITSSRLQLSGGSYTLNLPKLGVNEKVAVVAVHSAQTPTSTDKSLYDGMTYEIFSNNINEDLNLSTTSSSLSTGSDSSKRPVPKPDSAPPIPAQSSHLSQNVIKLLTDAKKTHFDLLEKTKRIFDRRPLPASNGGFGTNRSALTENFGKCVAPYGIGKICPINVISDKQFGKWATISTELISISDNAYWFVDETAKDELIDNQTLGLKPIFRKMINEFETRAYPIDTRFFGEIPDTDRNGKIIIVLTPELVGLKSITLGYVAPWDLSPQGSFPGATPEESKYMLSNEGDFFYAVTPGIIKDMGFTEDEYVTSLLPGVLVHELKHLIASGYKLLNDLPLEEFWIEEPSAVAAEELAGLGSKTGLTQIRANPVLENPQIFRINYSERPTDEAEQIGMYGFNFLFLWNLYGDPKSDGGSGFWKALIQNPKTGMEGLANLGVSFEDEMLNFAVSLLLDGSAAEVPGLGFQNIDLKTGAWSDLLLEPLAGKIKSQTRSFAFYQGHGTGENAKLTLKTPTDGASFVIIRGQW